MSPLPTIASDEWHAGNKSGVPYEDAALSDHQWDNAVRAADFWANHQTDRHDVIRTGATSSVPSLIHHGGAGWPPASEGDQWYGYWDSHQHANEFVYTGGRYDDSEELLTFAEQARGASSSRAYSSHPGRTRRGVTASGR
ncbi:hypothetical protein KUF83_38525 [Streptomyces sp. BV286]|uniref:hypothetical protein n=1 Tax=Streptomyces sp. BV286 TaxID=2849672 RepID=UPI001C2F05CC|nr:hypothetical protein [Streptomyces sp. BV286]MBV1942397.1 hypothetical protein [Streptomyces sp. BV286]